MKLDLHLHSTASDGSDSPTRLVEIAAQKGMDVIALTDHDTTGGVKEASEAGKKAGVRVLRGVELSAFSSYEVHVLGYNIDVDNAAFAQKLSDLRQKRIDRAQMILHKLASFNIKLDMDELLAAGGSDYHGKIRPVEMGSVTWTPDAFTRRALGI